MDQQGGRSRLEIRPSLRADKTSVTSDDKLFIFGTNIPELVGISAGTVEGRTCQLVLSDVLYDGRLHSSPPLPWSRR